MKNHPRTLALFEVLRRISNKNTSNKVYATKKHDAYPKKHFSMKKHLIISEFLVYRE
jgi:hypothetical protein